MTDLNEYPRETGEFIPLVVTVDGVATTTDVETALTPAGTRPTVWTAAVVDDGRVGFTLTGQTVGVYQVWARVGTIVVDCGFIRVT